MLHMLHLPRHHKAAGCQTTKSPEPTPFIIHAPSYGSTSRIHTSTFFSFSDAFVAFYDPKNRAAWSVAYGQ